MSHRAYFEDPAYVPLVLHAYELWHELERASGEELLRVTGVLSVGEEGSEIIEGVRRAHQRMAEVAGAELRFETAAAGWEAGEGGVDVCLRDSSRITARLLILALGP